jgi:hypothetical protein
MKKKYSETSFWVFFKNAMQAYIEVVSYFLSFFKFFFWIFEFLFAVVVLFLYTWRTQTQLVFLDIKRGGMYKEERRSTLYTTFEHGIKKNKKTIWRKDRNDPIREEKIYKMINTGRSFTKKIKNCVRECARWKLIWWKKMNN